MTTEEAYYETGSGRDRNPQNRRRTEADTLDGEVVAWTRPGTRSKDIEVCVEPGRSTWGSRGETEDSEESLQSVRLGPMDLTPV